MEDTVASTTYKSVTLAPGNSITFTLPTGIQFGGTVNVQPMSGTSYYAPNTIQDQIDNIKKIVDQLEAESKMRKKYPALEHVYGQYEVMLEMCKSKESDDAAGENSQNT